MTLTPADATLRLIASKEEVMSVTRTPVAPVVRSVFESVLVGVDGTDAGREAARQAAALVGPEGALAALAVVETALVGQAGFASADVAVELRQTADAALEEARTLLGPHSGHRRVDGYPVAALRAEAAATGATLLALGTHEHRRLTEILIGGVMGELLHTAPCSVLVARPQRQERPFPSAIVVGDDGSPPAAAALAAARELAERTGAHLRVVKAAAEPVDVLADAAETADLLVVGSRGLHGLRALGSVSERLAHEAPCSVLVVRPPLET